MSYAYVKNNQIKYLKRNFNSSLYATYNNSLYEVPLGDGLFYFYIDKDYSLTSLKNKCYHSAKTFTDTSADYTITERIINPEIQVDIDPTSAPANSSDAVIYIDVYNGTTKVKEEIIYYDPVIYGHIYMPIVICDSFDTLTVNTTVPSIFSGTTTIRVCADKINGYAVKC